MFLINAYGENKHQQQKGKKTLSQVFYMAKNLMIFAQAHTPYNVTMTPSCKAAGLTRREASLWHFGNQRKLWISLSGKHPFLSCHIVLEPEVVYWNERQV